MTFQLIFQEIKHFNFLLTYSHYTVKEGVHLTLPTHIFSVQIKSGAYTSLVSGGELRIK